MKLHIKNFRSIKQLDLELAPITVLYGHNGTGKSSALYAPLTMRNIVVNPNQEISGFFNYGFTSLGSFEEVVFDHHLNNELELGISISDDNVGIDYKIALKSDDTGSFQLILFAVEGGNKKVITLPKVSFPLAIDHYYEIEGMSDSEWNGIDIKIGSESVDSFFSLPMKTLDKVDFVPLGRGFFRPIYSFGESKGHLTHAEREVSALLADNRHIEYDISHRLEKILNKDFRVRNQIGSADFSLDSIDRQSRIAASLVNEGFGVNQLVHLLAKVLHPDAGIVCIEEPEIHLHPTAIRRLVHALAEIVGESGNKRLLISTHSEQFIMSLLALVACGSYSPDDLAIYLVSKEGKASEFQRQQVSENGQIEDGLASFLEGELEDMKVFLGV